MAMNRFMMDRLPLRYRGIVVSALLPSLTTHAYSDFAQ